MNEVRSRVGDWDDLRGDKPKIGRPRFPVEHRTMERLESFLSGTKGKRLTYKALIQ